MSDDRWEIPDRIEPFPDRSAELAAALKKLDEAKQRFAEECRRTGDPMLLLSLGLRDWDHEMDNCYPEWPS